MSFQPTEPLIDACEKAGRVHDRKEYEAVLSDSEDDEHVLVLQQQKRLMQKIGSTKLLLMATSAAALLSIGVAVFSLVQLHQMQAPQASHVVNVPGSPGAAISGSGLEAPTGAELGDCGRSIAEAKAAGCVFDAMSWLWTSPACLHKELMEEWWERDDWKFYKNYTMQPGDEVSRELVESGEHTLLFTQRRYHKTHCSFMWKKTHLTMVNHLPIDSNLHSMHHLGHCNHVLLNDIYHQDVDCEDGATCPTQLTPAFTTCGYW